MKTCKRRHVHNEAFCPECRRITLAARYRRNADSIKARNKAQAEEYRILKAIAAKHGIAASK